MVGGVLLVVTPSGMKRIVRGRNVRGRNVRGRIVPVLFLLIQMFLPTVVSKGG
jgi:hypothetical protein